MPVARPYLDRAHEMSFAGKFDVTKATNRTVATGAALILLLLTPTWAAAHKAHEEAAREAAKASPPREMPTPETAADAELSLQTETEQHGPLKHSGHSHRAPSPRDLAEADIEAASAAATTPATTPTTAQAEASPRKVPKALAWLGKFHPPVTHFPIALLVAATIAELLFMRTGKIQFDHAARFSVWLGASAALVAAPLGWFFAGFQLVDDEWVQTAHRWFGTATALWSGGLLFTLHQLTQTEGSRGRFRLVLFAGAALVSITGFLGGSLLYGIDHYAW